MKFNYEFVKFVVEDEVHYIFLICNYHVEESGEPSHIFNDFNWYVFCLRYEKCCSLEILFKKAQKFVWKLIHHKGTNTITLCNLS